MTTTQNKNDPIETLDDRFAEVCKRVMDDCDANTKMSVDLCLSIADLPESAKRLLNIFFWSGRSTAIKDMSAGGTK